MGRGMSRRPMRVNGMEMPSPDLVKGPYEPDSMIHKFQLDSAQGVRYRFVWDSMMAATRPARDSIHQAVATYRRAGTEGYQQEQERQAALVHKLGKELEKAEGRFDKVIRKFLTDDQWGDFKDWRERHRETERQLREQQMQERGMGRRSGGGPPG